MKMCSKCGNAKWKTNLKLKQFQCLHCYTWYSMNKLMKLKDKPVKEVK